MSNAPFACALRAWQEHPSALKGYLIHPLADPPLAEDLLQDVFIKALREGERFCTGLDCGQSRAFSERAIADSGESARRSVSTLGSFSPTEDPFTPTATKTEGRSD
jgi:hypothetical protein